MCAARHANGDHDQSIVGEKGIKVRMGAAVVADGKVGDGVIAA